MKPTKDNMLMHGFILVTILATAKSAEAEITMEAAFQGHCGHTSPCEQLCYEIHDGMYECDCIEGYELNKNGYSCQVINSTNSSDGHSKSDEDVLYQKGASFSAKLANDNADDNRLNSNYASSSAALASSLNRDSDEDLIDDGEDESTYIGDDLGLLAHQQKVNSNDYYISNDGDEGDSLNSSPDRDISIDEDYEDAMTFERRQLAMMATAKPLNVVLHRNRNKDQSSNRSAKPTKALGSTSTKTRAQQPQQQQQNQKQPHQQQLQWTMIFNENMDDLDDYYTKQDMSIYDDVNNNQLNLRPINHLAYQRQQQQQQQQQEKRQLQQQQQKQQQQHHQMNTQTSNNNNNNNHQPQAAQYHNNKNLLKTATAAAAQTSSIATTGNGDIGNNGVPEHQSTNISNNLSSSETNEICNLECGIDGLCDKSEGISRCLCPFGKTGSNCMEDIKVRVPKFSKHSWLAFPALKGAYKHVQLRIEFRPESFDGIILLSGERDDLTGDFMALLLNKGFVEFWFDCGSGAGSVRSHETILLNEWNSVVIYRHRWDAWLVLNHGTKVEGRSNGLFSRITFREPVFLGGTGNITGLANRLPITAGFLGCIRYFKVNEHEYKFEEHPVGDVTKGFDIQDCITDKCFKYPCQHGGKCLPSDQGAVCLCPIGFVGDLCEIRMDLQVPSFNGSSFLRYAPLGDSVLIWLELKIILKPEQADGLILYSGPKHHGDFIALYLNNGYVEFTFNLGNGPAVVRSEYPLSIGQWHTVRISRTARLAVLKIDQMPEVMTISSNGFWHLSLPENLFVGGVNHIDKLPMDLKSKPFFMGCIQRIEINGHPLSIISEALGGTNVGNCPHACVARPCGPLSECIPQMESYECRCSAYNEQCNKAQQHKDMKKNEDSEFDKKTSKIQSKVHSQKVDGNGGDNGGAYNGLNVKANKLQQFEHQPKGQKPHKKGKKSHMLWQQQQQQHKQQHKSQQHQKLRAAAAAAATRPSTSTSTTTTSTTTPSPPPPMTTTTMTWQDMDIINKDILETQETLEHIMEKMKADELVLDDDEEDEVPDEDADEMEDDMIFRDIKAMHEQQEQQHEEELERQKHLSWNSGMNNRNGNSNVNGKSQRNRNKRKHSVNTSTTSTTTTTTTTTTPSTTTTPRPLPPKVTKRPFDKKSPYNRKQPHGGYVATKPDPHYKTPVMDKPQHKLSRLPTHYESFQTNTGSDILTFEDPIALEEQWQDFNEPSSLASSLESSEHEEDGQENPETESHMEMWNTNFDKDNQERDEHITNNNNEPNPSTPKENTSENPPENTSEDTFVMDESLFDENDGTEDYQRKQLAQDMKRIMANSKVHYTPKQPKLVITEYDYSNEEDEKIGQYNHQAHDSSSEEEEEREQTQKNKFQQESPSKKFFHQSLDEDAGVDDDGENSHEFDNHEKNDDNNEDDQESQEFLDIKKSKTNSDPTQTHTDWSLLSKFDLPSNENRPPIGVRKNFGACFVGHESYFHYNDIETMNQVISNNIDLNLRIKTRSERGVILWTACVGTMDQDSDDYLSLGIEDGYLHFRYNLGSGEVDIRFNATKISDGLWHRVRAIRNNQEGYLEVDGRKSITLRSPGSLRQLNTDTGLYVGGLPDSVYFPRRRYTNGIVGCISEIVISGEFKMNFDPNTLGTAHNVETGIL
ncbi:LOW QUALITY PROTEIN: EGF like, fibronectin type III and laminin G domains protein pikachurin [Haematobia irritans]|uniref:LOW QUALITY PROTEIN: EGF like, fibronectin type III and laminin G domains protein pikachurin n=1 Tax=Haematobia irritans TaxID=7368 RepID=UPI003F506F9E